MSKVADLVIKWHKIHGRHNLPWQINPTPYRVWVSEIMLQQTQVKTVIPYYQRFMTTCPKLSDLANLPLDKLMYLWQGLGYYSRARNLHKAANIIHQKGSFPAEYDDLLSLPGIGESTASAILSLAYQKPFAIMDGNVKRVFCRYFGIDTPPQKALKELWKLAKDNLSYTDPRAYTQGLMDLGANICQRQNPQCHLCPLQKNCYAHLQEKTHLLPIKSPKKPKRHIEIHLLMPLYQNKIGLIIRQKGIWEKLYTPFIYDHPDQIKHPVKKLKPYKHELTHRTLHIYPYYCELEDKNAIYCDLHNIPYAIPTGIKPAIEQLKSTQGDL